MPTDAAGVLVRRTRPANRRATILATATRLFFERGFASVTIGEIATEVGVAPSAIYRHFGSKSEILIAAIRASIIPFSDVLLDAGHATNSRSLQKRVSDLVQTALANRELGVLWQREARNLDPSDRKMLRSELRAPTHYFAGYLESERHMTESEADLISWCTVAVLISVGFHNLNLPHRPHAALLVDLAYTLVTADGLESSGSAVPPESVERSAVSRKQALQAGAIQLFAERGFAAVGINEIGEAVGVAGPTLYSHFPSKETLLWSAMEQGSERLRADANRAQQLGGSAQSQLQRLVDSYVSFAVTDRFLLKIVMSEQDQLSVENRDSARRQQREYIDIWAHLLQEYRSMDVTSARITVQAVLLLVSDITQTPHLQGRPGLQNTLRRIAAALLKLPVPLDGPD